MAENVYWNLESGATCPLCGIKKVPVTSSQPWSAGTKVRYHKCGSCGARFKSIQLNQEAMHKEVKKAIDVQKDAAKNIETELARLNGIFSYS